MPLHMYLCKLKISIVLKHTITISAFFISTIADSVADNKHAQPLRVITIIGDEAIDKAEIGGTPVKELPINVHVVNEEEIERLHFVDPNELLDRIPGETQVRNLRIPNGAKGYTIPMVDGIALENPYEGATQRIDRVNTLDIQRVEVVKGPSSAIYPNNAFGGVINVVTREAPKELETNVWLEAGDFNRERAGINTGGTYQKLGYFVDINTYNLDGLRDGVKNDRDQFSTKLIYDPTVNTRIITRLEHLGETIAALGDLTAEEIDDDPSQRGSRRGSFDEIEQETLSLKLEQLFDTSRIDFSLVYREKDTKGVPRFGNPQDENDVGISAKFIYRYDFMSSNIITGFETYDGKQESVQFGRNDLTLQTPVANIDASRDIRALFLQYETELTYKLGLTLGARYESIDISSHSTDSDDASGSRTFSDTSPKFGLTYDLSPNNMLWLGIFEGFYAPEIDDIFGDGQAESVNLNLKPEQSRSIEFGLRGNTGAWSYDVAYYYNQIKNYLVVQEFSFDPNAPDSTLFERTTNAGQVTVQGLESVIEYAPIKAKWRVGFSHTYARNIYDDFMSSSGDFSGNELGRSPRHHFNGRLAISPLDGLIVELEGDFYSSYYSDDANTSAGRFKRDERIHLRVNYDYDNWRFWLHGLNLSDTQEDRATYRASSDQLEFRTVDGRTFYAGVSYHF